MPGAYPASGCTRKTVARIRGPESNRAAPAMPPRDLPVITTLLDHEAAHANGTPEHVFGEDRARDSE